MIHGLFRVPRSEFRVQYSINHVHHLAAGGHLMDPKDVCPLDDTGTYRGPGTWFTLGHLAVQYAADEGFS